MRLLVGTCSLLLLAVAPADLSPSAPNLQGAPEDELAECLVRSTSEADKALLVRWLFALLSLHPSVQSIAAVPDTTLTGLHAATAGLLERLLTSSCRTEARLALANGGPMAFQASFGVLGKVAATELFASPEVTAGMETFATFLDGDKLQAALGPDGE